MSQWYLNLKVVTSAEITPKKRPRFRRWLGPYTTHLHLYVARIQPIYPHTHPVKSLGLQLTNSHPFYHPVNTCKLSVVPGVVSTPLIYEDISDRHQLFLDVRRGLFLTPTHFQRVRAPGDTPSHVPARLGWVLVSLLPLPRAVHVYLLVYRLRYWPVSYRCPGVVTCHTPTGVTIHLDYKQPQHWKCHL